MTLQTHSEYDALVQKAEHSHQQNRSPEGITPKDVARSRLYSYAFRLHTIGAFHATRIALQDHPPQGPAGEAHRTRASEALEDLANQTMEIITDDFRVVIGTFFRYHRGVTRVIDALEREIAAGAAPAIKPITERFRQLVEAITTTNGIYLTQDTHAPDQGSFIVPNLGITIVPLVYGDYPSWNLAWLAGEERNVPTHRHRDGVEIHLGYNPTHGETVLGDYRAQVDEGYAMPIPPGTDHGWINSSDTTHHVPFIFGSLKHGGWGVFLDVTAATKPVSQRELVDRDAGPFSQMVHLEQAIDKAARMAGEYRTMLIPFTVTHRGGSGGLELNLTRIGTQPYTYERDAFRIVSISRGTGVVSIDGIEATVKQHDHFGIPSGAVCQIRQAGGDALVALDAMIKGY